MPSDKRARQRAARAAKLEAEARADKRRRTTRRVVILVVVAVAVLGLTYLIFGRHSKATPTASSSTTSTSTTTSTTTPTTTSTTATTVPASDRALQAKANAIAVAAGCPASPSTRVNTLQYSAAPSMSIDPSKTYTATMVTTAGTFTINLDAKTAPQTVNNFVFLARQGYYKCVIFHRVIPMFMDQTGDPQGTGTGGPGYTIPDENPPTAGNSANQYPLGSVAMANTGQPHSGGSQFFIVAGSQGEALPNSYALFGQVPSSGLGVVEKINSEGSAQGVPPNVTERILSVTIKES